jgi:glycosyltransferase involved in cell wall biosynthesis
LPKLSIISHFYNHHDKVIEQVKRWSRIDPEVLCQIEFILVDDCSNGLPDIKKYGLDIRLLRIETDIPWNQAGARNLGALVARGEWGLFFDVDQVLDIRAIGILLENLSGFDTRTMYYMKLKEPVFNSIDNVTCDFHLATFLVRLNTFRTIGMYGEDFAGHYGYEDVFLPFVWDSKGGKRILLSNPCFFEKMQNFHTTNLDRDLAHNRSMISQKTAMLNQHPEGDTPQPKRLLRFDWHAVALDDDQSEDLNSYGSTLSPRRVVSKPI